MPPKRIETTQQAGVPLQAQSGQEAPTPRKLVKLGAPQTPIAPVQSSAKRRAPGMDPPEISSAPSPSLAPVQEDSGSAATPAVKRVKKEMQELPTPARGRVEASIADTPVIAPVPKRPKLNKAASIVRVLSALRFELESISDVEGVREIVDNFPECVLLGGIAARRELLAALIGEHGPATSASAAIVAPGMRQPIALELRNSTGSDGIDFGRADSVEVDRWLQEVAQAASQALGSRLKVEPLRLRLAAVGCSSLDIVDIPEKGWAENGPTTPRVEEMRLRYLGSPANLLVCLEPGAPLELCRRFDAGLRRTVLLGAASANESTTLSPAQTTCGVEAARSLEERFEQLCRERIPLWRLGLERLEMRLKRAKDDAVSMATTEAPDEVLSRAKAAGITFGRALQNIVDGAAGSDAGALTLEDELVEFSIAAKKGLCGTGHLTGEQAAEAAADLFASLNGVEGYSAYLCKSVAVPGADVPLNGGAAWNRLLAEIEVAMRLACPSNEELRGLAMSAMRCGGTGVHGHQRWEDVASKLMLAIAYEPLRRRVRYVAARVNWVLQRQKLAIVAWMASIAEGPASRFHSPLFAQHLEILRSNPLSRDLVFEAFNGAASAVAVQMLKNLEGTLTSGCINPEIMLRPSTQPDMDPTKFKKAPLTPHGGEPCPPSAIELNKERVKSEISIRSSSVGGLPMALRDRVFESSEAVQTMPYIELQLRRAFQVLSKILARQAFAFADASMAALCRREVDAAMSSMKFGQPQQRVLEEKHAEFAALEREVDGRLQAVRRCIANLQALRGI